MSADILERLRAMQQATETGCPTGFVKDIWQCAADEIEHLRGLLADEQYIRMKADYSRGQKSWANMIEEREARRT